MGKEGGPGQVAGTSTVTGGAVGVPGVAGSRKITGLAGVCVITWGRLANGGNKTAIKPRDGFSQGIGIYSGPCIVLPTP